MGRSNDGATTIILGLTGTRHGCTAPQLAALRDLLRRLQPAALHHGDCVGADDEAATLCGPTHTRVICHPPLDERLRAFNPHADETLPPKSHFARNRDIVDACEALIACPPYLTPITAETRGGTAYTVTYARRKGKRIWIIWPDGNVSEEA